MSTLRTARLPPRAIVAVAATGIAAVGTGVYVHRRHQRSESRILLPRITVEAIAGAVGEVCQALVLYPLDTVKVRCQAAGMPSSEVIKELFSQGFSMAVFKQLYAGALGAALCSIAVGAVHFASFENSRRMIVQHQAKQAAACDTASTPASEGPAAAGSKSSSDPKTAPLRQDGKLLVNILAAACAAFVTAVVESPVELFRHNQQAGLVKGNFLREMVAAVRRDGPAGLYWGFLPHCFEAWPHDISELLVYGGMKDLHEDSLHPLSAHHWWMRSMPLGVWDLTTGAAAGAAAVLISMPFDCIKTYMQTHGTDVSGKSVLEGARLFMRTGSRMVARGGPGALYYGVVPRLLQQVPSSMVCWFVIHAVQRLLLPYTQGAQDAPPHEKSA